MFGADAAQISFQFDSQVQRNKNKPPDALDYLFPKFVQPMPWLHTGQNGSSQCLEDFILIAEFSEQEGPRPVIVIPKDGGQNFNQNDFSVKILAVDHQSSIVEGFEMTEDAQVVMTDPETEAHAFIHHIVLNDIQARGYVRPFCISYVTTDPLKIMKCYEEISTQMKKVARLMKYGNRLVFMRDLEKFQEDLSYTKAHLLISQSRTQHSPQGDSDLLNALNTLRQCMEEVKDILSNLKPLLQLETELSERFQSYEREHKQQFKDFSDSSSLKDFDTKEDHFAEKELSGSCSDRTSPIFSLFSKCKHQKPKVLDVSTIRGKRRFDWSLRGLHELCSWGAKEGLQKLRAFREFLKRDLASIYVDELDMASLVPDSGVLCFGSNTVGANFLSTIHSPKGGCCSKRKISYCSQHHSGLNSLGSVESFKSFTSSFQSFYDDDTMYSAQSSMADTSTTGPTYHRAVSISSELHEGSDILDTQYDQEFMFHHDNSVEVNNEYDDSVDDSHETVASSLSETLKCELNIDKLTKIDGPNNNTSTPRQSTDVSDHSSESFYTIDIDNDLKCSAKGCKCDPNNDKDAGHQCNENDKGKDCQTKVENKQNDFKKHASSKSDLSDKIGDMVSLETVPDRQGPSVIGDKSEVNSKSVITDGGHNVQSNAENVKQDQNVKPVNDDNGIKPEEDLTINENMTDSQSPSKQGGEPNNFLLSARSLDSGLDLTTVRDRQGYNVLNSTHSLYGMSYGSSVGSVQDNTRKRKWRFLHSSKYLFDGEYTLGQSLLKVLPGYNNLQHIVFSLLSGRPVIVMGTRKQENSLRELVQALSVFVPYTPRAGSVGLLCQIKQMKMSDVHKFQLRGLLRSDKKSVDYLVPKTCRRYVTLVDLEKQQVYCPSYQGALLNFLLSIHSKKKTFKSDTAVYSYIQLCLEEISNKAFGFYHRITSSDSDMNIHGSSVLHKSVMLDATSEKCLSEIGIRNSDCIIIKHLAEVVKIQQIDEEFKSKYLTDAPAYPFSVNYQATQTFKL